MEFHIQTPLFLYPMYQYFCYAISNNELAPLWKKSQWPWKIDFNNKTYVMVWILWDAQKTTDCSIMQLLLKNMDGNPSPKLLLGWWTPLPWPPPCPCHIQCPHHFPHLRIPSHLCPQWFLFPRDTRFCAPHTSTNSYIYPTSTLCHRNFSPIHLWYPYSLQGGMRCCVDDCIIKPPSS